jgi:hypothetical protein
MASTSLSFHKISLKLSMTMLKRYQRGKGPSKGFYGEDFLPNTLRHALIDVELVPGFAACFGSRQLEALGWQEIGSGFTDRT